MKARDREGINIEISGEFKEIKDIKKEVLKDTISNLLNKYTEAGEVDCVDVYIKKFEATHLGRPLVFCNVTFNTPFGVITEHGSAWGVRQALRQAIKNSLVSIERAAEETTFGSYVEPELFA